MSNDKSLVQTFQEMQIMATAFSKSGFFKDAADEAKAIVKIAYGRELGLAPVASMCGIYLTSQGKLELDSGLISSLIKDSERYDYKVRELNNDKCVLEFFERGESVGLSTFGKEDAVRAGLSNKDTYQKYPRNLYFARALTNGSRWYCSNLFGGAIYAQGEIQDSNTQVDREEIKVVPLTELVSTAPPVSVDERAALKQAERPTRTEWTEGLPTFDELADKHFVPMAERETIMRLASRDGAPNWSEAMRLLEAAIVRNESGLLKTEPPLNIAPLPPRVIVPSKQAPAIDAFEDLQNLVAKHALSAGKVAEIPEAAMKRYRSEAAMNLAKTAISDDEDMRHAFLLKLWGREGLTDPKMLVQELMALRDWSIRPHAKTYIAEWVADYMESYLASQGAERETTPAT